MEKTDVFLPKNPPFSYFCNLTDKTSTMKKLFAILLALFAFVGVKANDGAFYSNGTQLIPITETTIKVQKEVLTITRIPDNVSGYGSLFQVNVYYEFYNPGKARDLLVGFESPTPDGNGYGGTLDEAYKGQPYIYDFKVKVNKADLPYQLAHVPYQYQGDYQFDFTMDSKSYYKNGRVQDMTKDQYSADMAKIFKGHEDYMDIEGYLFYYVYYFNAHFNQGLNVIEHTYTFKGSALVTMDYIFSYILTAANRWANNGIDDFTLRLDMGEHESFSVNPTFYKDASEWTFDGKGRSSIKQSMTMGEENLPIFHVQSGSLVFHKKNFHPEGELNIYRDGFYIYGYDDDVTGLQYNVFVEALKSQYYNLNVENLSYVDDKEGLTAEEKRILKNMPFAYRGYVFNDKGLQRFFNSTKWYIANPDYKADMGTMSKEENRWINFWKE